jgi:uncharacterized YigZ family protein
MQYTYWSISAPSEALFKDRGSKFIAYAYPVASQEEIKTRLKQLKELHPKAVHHCYAWRLGIDGTQFRANDDGEPSGSAGRPILGQIDSEGVTNTLVVVVRYFGGTLLGVPGLINAYKTVTEAVLTENEKIEKPIEVSYELEYEYPIMNQVLYTLKQHQAHIIKNDLMLFCQTTIAIALQEEAVCIQKLEKIHGLKIVKLVTQNT